jgi:enolase
MNITSVKSWWALDSRGNPTVTTQIMDDNGNVARSYVPSGASTGTHEALELRDGEAAFFGKGVTKAVDNINTIISAALTGKLSEVQELEAILLSLDTTDNKSSLGANAILGVSMALHRLQATNHDEYLADCLHHCYFVKPTTFPRLMCNIINGGAHSDAGLAIQEFMVVPRTGSLPSDVQAASEIYHTLKKLLAKRGLVTAVGDEGGFAPHIKTTEEVFQIITEAISTAGYADTCDLALDCAASEFYNKETGTYAIDSKDLTKQQLTEFYTDLCGRYPIISIEDGYAEDDLEGWKIMTKALGDKIKLVGDDLFVTNIKRLQSIGIDQHIGNALLVKLNQIGSVTETVAAIKLAQEHGFTTIISHRSGETEDSFIADLAVASASEFIKLGAPARTDRTVKYNRLLELYHSTK